MRFRGQLGHRSGSPALKFSGLHTLGRGTNSLRRTMPTLDSTAPFSRPEYGLPERTIQTRNAHGRLEQVRQARLALPVPALWPAGDRTRSAPAHRPATRTGCATRARALSVLARHQLHQTDVRIREIKHEMMHPLHHAAQQHVDLAEIGLRLARMPYQIHERLITLRRELTPEPRHRRVTVDGRPPRHARPSSRSQIHGRGMPLLAPVRAILREPLLDHGRDAGRSPTRAAFSPTARPTDPPSRNYLRTVGSLTCVFRAIDATDSPVPQTTDRLYLGHADH